MIAKFFLKRILAIALVKQKVVHTFVDGPAHHLIPAVVEHRRAHLRAVPLERVHAPATSHVPHAAVVVKPAGADLVPGGVEAEGDDLRGVTHESARLHSFLHVPELRGVVHGAGGDDRALRVETEADNLAGVAAEGVVTLAAVRVPELARLIEAARDDLITVRVIERDGVHHVLVPLQRVNLLSGVRVEHLARPVVAPGDELIAALVERAVGQGQDVRPQLIDQREALGGHRAELRLQLLHQLPQ